MSSIKVSEVYEFLRSHTTPKMKMTSEDISLALSPPGVLYSLSSHLSSVLREYDHIHRERIPKSPRYIWWYDSTIPNEFRGKAKITNRGNCNSKVAPLEQMALDFNEAFWLKGQFMADCVILKNTKTKDIYAFSASDFKKAKITD